MRLFLRQIVFAPEKGGKVTHRNTNNHRTADDVFAFIERNADALESAIVHERDFSYNYFGFKTLERSYLLKCQGRIVERPQHMLMRVACGIHATSEGDGASDFALTPHYQQPSTQLTLVPRRSQGSD